MAQDALTRLPDLPAQESVQIRNRCGVTVFALFLVPILYGLVGSIVDVAKDPAGYAADPVFGAGVPGFWALVCAALLYVVLCADYAWQTSAEGLGLRSVTRRRFIPWSAIRDARRVSHATRPPEIRVVVGSRVIGIDGSAMGGVGSRGVRLAASIWQHLHRRGVADASLLPPEALSFWEAAAGR